MFFNTNQLFTIGQFAKLHEINKKTLMWYDEVGILKPAIVKENGYRYYTFQQSSLLETILMLRDCNMSISEIRNFLNNRSASTLEHLLSDKISELDSTIAHLKTVKAILEEKKNTMSTIRNLEISDISIIDKKEAHTFVTVTTSQDVPLEKEIEKIAP